MGGGRTPTPSDVVRDTLPEQAPGAFARAHSGGHAPRPLVAGTLGEVDLDGAQAVWMATVLAEDQGLTDDPARTYKPRVFATDDGPRRRDHSAAVHQPTMTFKPADGARPDGRAKSMRTLSSPHPERTTLVPMAEGQSPADAPVPDGPGYHLIERIGEGGMGVVWRGYQGSLLRQVAIKQVRREGADESFLAEAMVTGFLDHPNIVPVHSLGQDRDGSLFMSMKLVDGVEWRDLLQPQSEAHRERSLALGLEGHLRILLSVCNAVAYAHSRDVIHRDLKPGNVMIGGFGEVVVMDWGIALDIATPPRLPRRTRHRDEADQVAGTPAYMAPEMALGRGDLQGPWTDVYLLGGLLYEVLTGRPPHRAANVMATLLAASRAESPPLGPEVPEDLASLCRDALAREPAERIADVPRFQARLQAHLEHRESILLSDRAEAEVIGLLSSEARSEDDRDARYAAWAKVVARYEQALELHADNHAAIRGVLEARVAFGREALAAGDLGLANAQIASLKGSDRESVSLRHGVERALRRRARAERQARRSRSLLVGAGVLLALGLVIGLVLINAERARATAERDAAHAARVLERQHRERAEVAHQDARALLAESLVAQADGMVLGGSYDEALPLVGRALKRLRALGRDPLPAQLGMWMLLRHATLPLWVQTAHQAPVRSVGVSWDGRQVLSTGASRSLSLWDGPSGRQRHQLQGHDQRVLVSALSGDGRRAVSGGADHQVRVWDTVSGRTEQVLDGHLGEVLGVFFSGDDRVVSYGADNALIVWSVPTGQPIVRLQHDALLLAASVSGDGTRVFSQDAAAFRIWEVEGGTPAGAVPYEVTGDLTPWRATFLPGGTRALMLLHGAEGVDRLELWDSHLGRREQVLQGSMDHINAFQLTEDGRWAISGGHGLRLWDVASGQSIAHLAGLPDEAQAVSLSPDGSFLAAGDAAGRVGLWARLPQRALRTLSLPARAAAVRFAAGGRLLLVRDQALPGRYRYYDADTGARLAELAEGLPDEDRLGVAEDGTLVTLEASRPLPELRVLDPLGHEERSRHAIPAVVLQRNAEGAPTEVDRPRMLHLLPGGGQAVLVGRRGSVCRHQVDSGERLASYVPTPADRTTAARWSVMASSGSALLVGGAERQLLWGLPAGRSRSLQRVGVFGAALDPAGEVLALAEGATITLWGVADLLSGGAPVPRKRLRGGRSGITQLVFLHGGALLAAGTEDRAIALWHVQSGRRLRLLHDKGAAWPLPLAASAGRLRLASPGLGHTLLVWDFEHAARFLELMDQLPAALAKLAVAPGDGASLAVMGAWYALRGKWRWATEALQGARAAGASVDLLTLARALHQSGQLEAVGPVLDEAARAPDDVGRSLYLKLALEAARR